MIDRYFYIEKLVEKDSPYSIGLSLEENNNPALRIFRLLTGTCDIRDEYFGKTYKFRINYTDIPFSSNKATYKSLRRSFPDEVTLADISAYFEKLKSNEEFYSLVEFELINCLTARDQKQYLEAFIFLYRLLEGISYSVPLMYVSRSRSFMSSFKALQAAMPTSEKEGELLLFKNFIDSSWKDKDFYESTLDIDLSVIEVEEMRSVYFNIYKKYLGKGSIESETEDEEIRVRFPEFRGFLVSIRNRYFHFLQGSWQKNIESGEIVFPDLFFKPLIDLGLNWIAICLFEIISFDIENSLEK